MKSRHIAIAVNSIGQLKHLPMELDEMIQPGSTVDLFVRTKTNESIWTLAQMSSLEHYDSAALAACKRQWCGSMDEEKHLAERGVASLRDTLATKGIELEVHIYAGPLREALHDLMTRQQRPMMVLRLRSPGLFAALLHKLCKAVGMTGAAEAPRVSLELRHGHIGL